VHGFPGYSIDAAIPTLRDILDGRKPANTASIRVDIRPGSKVRYSGGGTTVMQQMMIDVTGQPFDEFMRVSVLSRLGMANSSYNQSLTNADMARERPDTCPMER
jgi:CubicO group peptidase (beta-lactamase class C family)